MSVINPRFTILPKPFVEELGSTLIEIRPDGSIPWPWISKMTVQERITVELASKPQRPFDYDLYDRVLEERTIRANKGVL